MQQFRTHGSAISQRDNQSPVHKTKHHLFLIGKTTSAMNYPDTLRTLSSVWGMTPRCDHARVSDSRGKKAESNTCMYTCTRNHCRQMDFMQTVIHKLRHLLLNPIRGNPDSHSHKQHAYQTKPL